MNYFIYGEEVYLSKKKLDEIIQKNVGQVDDINTVYFDFDNKDTTIKDLINECNTLPFFNDNKVVVLINPSFLKTKGSLSDSDLNVLTKYLENPNVETCLIIYSVYDKIDSRKKIFKTLIKNCSSFEHKKMDEAGFESYVKTNIKQNNITITKDALTELLKRLPNDLMNFHHELDKLKIYNDIVDIKVIKSLIAPSYEDDIFKLVNSVQNGNCNQAIKYLHDLYSLNTEPIYIMKLIASQYRFMYQVKVLSNNHFNDKEIATRLGANPYRVTISKKSLFNYSTKQLLSILSDLCNLDIRFKSENTDRKLLLETFIINTTRRIICNR